MIVKMSSPIIYHVLGDASLLILIRSSQPPSIMSSTANSKTAESSNSVQPAKPEAQPHLGVLEEDDEFEEFPVAGSFIIFSSFPYRTLF